MRVIAGSHRGARLIAPRGAGTRPTADRVREAVFSMLDGAGAGFEGMLVLDLFAGSGAMGIEALSRGARAAVFVDSAPAAATAITRNLASLGIEAEVVRRDALAALRSAPAGARQYDLIFIDPPYQQASALAASLSVALPTVLAPGARVVVECSRRRPLMLAPTLPLARERTYGDTLIRIHHGDR